MRRSLDVQTLCGTLLTPERPWVALDFFDSVDSTNLEALRHPTPWRVVVSDHQSAGRGRLARAWEAPPRASLAVSCVLPTGDGADLGWLPLLAGLAMRSALLQVAGVPASLKWPNDLLAMPPGASEHAARKVCGVLCQSAGGALVVVGSGVNVDQEPAELPVDTATSLRLCGAQDVRREDVVRHYLDGLADLYAVWLDGGRDWADVRADYRSRCSTVGRTVDLHRPGGEVLRGVATGVDDQGRLLVRGPSGTAAHAAGDVVHVRTTDTR